MLKTYKGVKQSQISKTQV